MITDTQRDELRRRLLAGETRNSIATAMGIHHSTVGRIRDRMAIEAGQGAPFEMPPGHAIKGTSVLLDPTGVVKAKWIKTRAEVSPVDAVEAIKAALADFEPRAPFIAPPAANDDDILTVYPLPDLHIGMLAWGRETGANYDLKIAVARAREMMAELIAEAKPSRQCVVLGLGDWFHCNDRTNMTPRSGHILDVDGRWPRVLEAGIRLAMDIIEMAAERHDEVIVRFIPGNHDPDATAALMAALRVFYANNPRILLDEGEGEHFYIRFGRVLLGASHGHTMKPDRMAMMLATDRPEDWGATKFRYFYFGHVHHDSLKEVGPVRVESFNTPASRDAHAHGGGYRSGQSLSAIFFHRERGEIGRHRVNLVAA